jgi:phage tail sheath protein FI
MITNLATPGVYINEVSAFPNSVVQVATAVPAFIGYTPWASYEGKSYTMKPMRITSMTDFNAIFCNPNAAKQYSPQYYITQQKKAPLAGESYSFNNTIYTIEPDPGTVYHLYNSVLMFFQNGGSVAYIVSLGSYGQATNSPINPGSDITNMNVQLTDYKAALAALKKVDEVTMYVAPESTLLSDGDYQTLLESMLMQSSTMQTTVSIIDVKGGREPDPILWPNDIQNFRNWTGNTGLNYGAAYYPFLKTTVVPLNQVDYTNIGNTAVLMDILSPPTAPNTAAASILNSISAGNSLTVMQNNQALMMASPAYTQILTIIQEKINTLPPSGVMAGVYSYVDGATGCWAAPANVSPVGVTDLTIQLDDDDQAGLNVDAISGKSVNAFRFFNGQGVLVWGARTLDGNSQDWCYIPVRRTVTMIEQSIKDALRAYVFAPNDSNTWVTIKSMLQNFLTNVWKEGALAGAKPEDAFSVQVGLGVTMTAQDILNGYLRVTVMIAVTHPAEFIVVTVEQQLQQS